MTDSIVPKNCHKYLSFTVMTDTKEALVLLISQSLDASAPVS